MSSFQRLIRKFNQFECINRQDFAIFWRGRIKQIPVFVLSACDYCTPFAK
jgi:hypothetical protein